MTEREAWIALNLMEGVGPVRVRALSEALGGPVAIFEASREALGRAEGVGPRMVERIVSQRGEVDPAGEEARAERMGIRLVARCDPDYPALLREIHDPPMALYLRGRLDPADAHAIAMIGSRRCTHYGAQVADRLAHQLCRQGHTVISGLARGIDTAAHRGALNAGGRTIAVLGCGLDQCYPPENRDLAEEIAATGALLSEFPLGTAPSRTTFPMRNRIVSGMSKGVLVVEAGRQSGAMITVDEAAAQGRTILAVPGRIDNPSAGGCHELIKNGAKLVETVDDILEEYAFLIPPTPKEEAHPRYRNPEVQLTDDERRVLDVLGHDEMAIDVLIRETQLASHQVTTTLLTLEMKRQVKNLPGRRVVRMTV